MCNEIIMVLLFLGASGGLYGVNGRFIEIKDVTNYFKARTCPSLAGKPKMFFLQACQGRSKQQGNGLKLTYNLEIVM